MTRENRGRGRGGGGGKERKQTVPVLHTRREEDSHVRGEFVLMLVRFLSFFLTRLFECFSFTP